MKSHPGGRKYIFLGKTYDIIIVKLKDYMQLNKNNAFDAVININEEMTNIGPFHPPNKLFRFNFHFFIFISKNEGPVLKKIIPV